MLRSDKAKKVLVLRPISGDENFARMNEAADYSAVGLDVIERRYRFVRQALIDRLESGTLNVERSTAKQGKSTAISYHGSQKDGLLDPERIEVTPEKYADYVLVLVDSLVVPPIVALALPAVVSVAEALTEVVGTVVAAVSVGSPLLTVVGWLVASLAEPVVEPVSGLQAASRVAAVRRVGRWRANMPAV